MSDENPPPLPPRIRHIPGHGDPGSAIQQQQDMQLWQHFSALSQPQQTAGVQAVPVGIGFSSRPQQQVWPDHSSAFSQRGWQPFSQAHTQQSPQESQELNPQVVRSQHQNWPGGEVNPIQLQQLQQLFLLQQQQQQQQQQHHIQQLQQQQHQHQPDQGLHHLDPIGQHDDHNHEKFTKSPSPQIEDNRNSPAVGRQFIQHNMTSPQQQLWQHPQVMHQYDMQHGEPQHSQPQAFQHTPVSHHQPLFAQQPYVHQPVWQHHTPYSQVQVQHLRQSTPPMQQHVLWHQQQQQQLQQHQMQQQQHQQHLQQHHPDPPPPYSPPSSSIGSFTDKPTSLMEKKDMEMQGQSLFNNNRLPSDPIVSRNDKLGSVDTMVTTVNTGPTPTAPPPSMSVNNSVNSPKPPIRILSKSNQNLIDSPGLGQRSQEQQPSSSYSNVSVPPNVIQRPVQGIGSPVNNQNVLNAPKPQNFNPNPNMNPYQNLNNQNNYKMQGLYGSQQHTPRYPSPVKDRNLGQSANMNQYRPRSPAAVVRSHQPQGVVINNVYQRTVPTSAPGSNFHRVENIEVNLFVQGLNPRTRSDSIQNYFEAVGKPASVKDNILFNLEHTEALVIFQQKPDMMRLKQNVKTRKLDGFSLETCEVLPPRAIVISSDTQIRSIETVKLYFERDSVGGPLKKNGVDETEDGCCLLEFEDSRVVLRICSNPRTHKVDGVPLRVSPYYQCENGAIWDMHLHVVPVPKPVNIQILPDQLEFVKKHCQPLFTSRLRDKYADVSYSKDHVTVKCMLRQTMPNYRVIVRGWATGVQEAVARFFGLIDQVTIGILDNIWDDISDFLNSGKQELKDIFMKPDRERHALKLVGNKGNVKNAQQVIENKIKALNRAARRKTETRKVKSAEHLTILELQGTYSTICGMFDDLVIHVEGNEVTVEGDPADIPNAFIEMYTECEKIEPKNLKHLRSREWVQFMKKENAKAYIQRKLDQKKLWGSWTVTNSDLGVFVPAGGNSDKIRDIVFKCIVEEKIEVDQSSTDLLSSDVWDDFQVDLKRRANDKAVMFTKKPSEVVVIGLDETVSSIVKQIKDFLDSKTVKSVLVQCDALQMEFINHCWTEDDYAEINSNDVVLNKKANGLELSGLADNLIKGKQKLDLKLKRMCSKKHQLRKTGIQTVLKVSYQSGTIASIEKEFKCVIKLPNDLQQEVSMLLSDYEYAESDYYYDQGDGSYPSNSNSAPKCFQTKRHKIKIHLVHGEIGHQKADIIVASAASSLNLRSGSASYSLVKQGGTQLQAECEKLYPNGIQNGEVACIGPGQLSCDKVYLSSLPSWKEASANNGKVFRNLMRECLRLADRNSKKTVAFSAMGTGPYLGYPREVVASVMYGAVVEFDSSYKNTSLKDITIVLHGKDAETIKAFEDHEHMRIHGSTSLGVLSTDFLNGKIKIELVTEDLSKQKVDALLCSVSTDMNLKRSAICKSLVQNGGPALENDCKQKYKNELQVGIVGEISSGNLSCKTIYITVLSQYTESNTAEQSLIDILQQVFTQANQKGYKSLAIPALGTGYLNYPKTTAARCMYDAVLDWVGKNPRASLRTIRFVMYSKDTESQQAYRACHLKSQGREARLGRHFLGDGTVHVRGDNSTKYTMIKDGCILGPVQLTVNVGDILTTKVDAIVNSVGANFDMHGAIAKALAAKFPNILPECQQKKSELKKDGVVTTSGAGLPATYVIHVQFQDTLSGWRNKMVACLEEAHRQKLKSVAFPVLGSGAGPKTFAPESVAECLFAAIDDFTSQNAGSTIVDVRLVVHTSNSTWKPAILSALQVKTTAANQPSIGRKLLGFLGGVFGSNSKPNGNQRDNNKQGSPAPRPSTGSQQRGPDCVQVVVYSDAIINIDRCIKALEDKICLEYIQRPVKADQDIITGLTDKQIDCMVDPDIMVDVKFDKKAGVFIINGPSLNVNAAMDCIHNKLRQFQREKDSKEMAKLVRAKIQWYWVCEDRTASGQMEKPYSELTNYTIEMAYKEGKDTLELADTDGKQYVVDFKRLVEFSKVNQGDTVKVVRKDILKASTVPIPSSWMNMSNNENLKRVTLRPGKEYSDVEKLFTNQVKTGAYSSKQPNVNNVRVTQIERLQNRTLYMQYSAKKKQMESQKPSKQLERKVWHGTQEPNILGIVNNGFNRSYCGAHGVWFGQGVYFAADASYSVQDYLTAGNKTGAKRHIFLVKALTGDFVKGDPSMRVPPSKSSNSTALYDSTVDDETNPMEFVIYHDTQAYPEYLVTFTL